MGLYYTAYQVNFSDLDVDLDALTEDLAPLYRQFGKSVYSIKTTRLNEVLLLEQVMEFLSEKSKRKILPFFIHTLWFYYHNEYDELTDFKRYSHGAFDDFGFLAKDNELYYRSYSCETLRRILADFDTQIDMNEIQQAYHRSCEANKNQFVPGHLSEAGYRAGTEEKFRNFKILLDLVLNAYRECVIEKKDLIIALL